MKKNKLRNYQIEDANFLTSIPCSACFNEQRTGKTPTALETIKLRHLENERILIITTATAQQQWQEEYYKWLGKPCLICSGTPKQKQEIIERWTHGLVISIDSFKTTKSNEGLIKPILKKKPKQIILDEAHKIKNPKSANAQALFKTTSIPYRLALTGTPAAGKPYDIYSILKFLFPDDFRGYWKFLEEYFIIEDSFIYRGGKKQSFKTYEKFKPGKDRELQEFLDTFSTQRKRKEVMEWLPEKYYVKQKLKPTKEQARYIKELEETFHTEDIITSNVLDRLVRFRQICLDPKLLGLNSKSPKTEWIKQYIKDNPDEQIIIFSKFTSYLYLLAQELPTTWALIVGDTPIKQRGTFIKDFQDKKFQVILINIDAGKEALTLDSAETTIFTDKYPPIGDILQAEDRFIASTPEKAHKAHKIIELMIEGTFDERIYELLEKRKETTDIINDYKKYLRKE